ncbi:MAG TPA: hypothetical protein VNA29_04875 [Sphingomicrobium sp.]|nr:hypothetical protein [Sphingomicrobium sp.]
MRLTAMLAAVAVIAACDGGGDPEPPLRSEIMVRSESQKRLFELDDLDRAIALKRAITEQGLRCARLVSTGYVARFRDMDMWTATCSDDRQWGLFVSANDSVQVRLCADNEKIGLPACKVQPGTEGGTGLENIMSNKAG